MSSLIRGLNLTVTAAVLPGPSGKEAWPGRGMKGCFCRAAARGCYARSREGGIEEPSLPPPSWVAPRPDHLRFRRRTNPSAERPTPSSANEDGSGAAVGVSENRFVNEVKLPECTDSAFVTVRLVAAVKVVLAVS